MSRALVLDTAAVEALTRSQIPPVVRAALEAASRLGREVLIPTVVLAESYRTKHHAQAVDSLLADRGRASAIPIDQSLDWWVRSRAAGTGHGIH